MYSVLYREGPLKEVPLYNPPDLSLMGKTIKIKFSIKGGVEKWHKGTVPVADLGF